MERRRVTVATLAIELIVESGVEHQSRQQVPFPGEVSNQATGTDRVSLLLTARNCRRPGWPQPQPGQHPTPKIYYQASDVHIGISVVPDVPMKQNSGAQREVDHPSLYRVEVAEVISAQSKPDFVGRIPALFPLGPKGGRKIIHFSLDVLAGVKEGTGDLGEAAPRRQNDADRHRRPVAFAAHQKIAPSEPFNPPKSPVKT